mgnify:CR=1 FL=1
MGLPGQLAGVIDRQGFRGAVDLLGLLLRRLAGLAAGVWKNEGELAALWREARRFEPQGSAAQAAERLPMGRLSPISALL